MREYESFFTDRQLYIIDQPDAQELRSLCCVVSGGKLWANGNYITDRYGYGRMLFVYVNEGAMFLKYGGQSHVIKSGEAFFIDCDPHQIYGTHGDLCVLTFIHFMGGPSDYLFKRISAKSGYVFGGYGAKAIKRCLDEVLAVTKTHAQNKSELFSEIITRALFSLLTHESVSDPLFDKAADIIRERVEKNTPIDVGGVAREIGYSKYYFTRKFTEAAGVSPYEFIIRERMSAAKSMLINTPAPVGDIALACGFFDASHMTNCFRKREGMTPLSFRRGWKKNV